MPSCGRFSKQKNARPRNYKGVLRPVEDWDILMMINLATGAKDSLKSIMTT